PQRRPGDPLSGAPPLGVGCRPTRRTIQSVLRRHWRRAGGLPMLARFTKAALVALMILALPVAAMAAAAPDKAEKVAAKMLDLDKAITTISTQLDVTLNSMNALAEPNGDLTAKYKAFTDNTAKLDKMAAKAKSTSQTAASQREEYLKQMQ